MIEESIKEVLYGAQNDLDRANRAGTDDVALVALMDTVEQLLIVVKYLLSKQEV